MQFCKDHWDKLRKAIEDRGLSHLVVKSEEAVFENIVAELQGEKVVYDPLIDCHWMITNKALETGGLYLLTNKKDGTQYCPVCEAVTHGNLECDWIDGPADAVLNYCREKNLVSKPS